MDEYPCFEMKSPALDFFQMLKQPNGNPPFEVRKLLGFTEKGFVRNVLEHAHTLITGKWTPGDAQNWGRRP